MISLRREIYNYDTSFSHPGRSLGSSSALYYLNHNLGANPKLLQVFSDYGGDTESLIPDYERWLNTSGLKYFFWTCEYESVNQVSMRFYYVSSSTVTIRVHMETW